jgi:pimeloyl-ACP methyl ester carboxylesterase
VHTERCGTGEAVVFIHGSGWNGRMWQRQRDRLRASMEVVLLDLPGHGESAGDGCDSVEEYRNATYEAIERLDAGRCYLVGHSLGGAIAISLALSHPEAVKGLVLIGTGARLRVLPQILEGLREEKGKTIRDIVALAFAEDTLPALKKHDFDETVKCRTEVIHKDFVACDRFDVMDSIATLAIPTLILCGTEDRLTPPKYSSYLHRAIRGSTLLLVEGAGHMVMMERPDEVNRAIEEFVRRRVNSTLIAPSDG